MLAICISILDEQILTLEVAHVAQFRAERINGTLRIDAGIAREIAYPHRSDRLPLTSERCRQRPKREPAEERAPVHHWMISSARTRSDCGIVNPSVFAVFRLMTSSNLVACSTGSSPGFVP